MSECNCNVWFVSELSSDDKAILDGIVAAHSGEPFVTIKKEQRISCGGSVNAYITVTDTTYKTVRKITFDGTNYLDTPTQVSFNIDSITGTGADVRLRDVTNNNTVAHKSIDAGAKTYRDKTTTNWPDEEAVLALQVKVTTAGDSVSITEATIGW
jgi:hypothetical protein